MAKAKTKKVAAEAPAVSDEPKSAASLTPEKVHELFGIPGPYEPPRGRSG